MGRETKVRLQLWDVWPFILLKKSLLSLISLRSMKNSVSNIVLRGALLLLYLLQISAMLSIRPACNGIKLSRSNACLLICDVQEKLMPMIYRSKTVESNVALLNSVAKIMSIPTLVTEQYPKGLGATVKVWCFALLCCADFIGLSSIIYIYME